MKIVASCIKFKPSGAQYSHYFTGRSHRDIYDALEILRFDVDTGKVEEGYITDTEQFVSKTEAFYIARSANQLHDDGMNPYPVCPEDI